MRKQFPGPGTFGPWAGHGHGQRSDTDECQDSQTESVWVSLIPCHKYACFLFFS